MNRKKLLICISAIVLLTSGAAGYFLKDVNITEATSVEDTLIDSLEKDVIAGKIQEGDMITSDGKIIKKHENVTEDSNTTTSETDNNTPLISTKDGLIPNLEYEIKGNSVSLEYSILNNSKDRKTVVFPNSQQYDFVITRKDGNYRTQYSEGKMFTQALLEQEWPPSETFRYVADLGGLEPGEYTAEFWFNGEGYDKFQKTVTFTIE
ncbi:BsuPI-related putative proteinase inhibitor [Niallia taxi]|uniref:BsuPI-related putative proteinase inhibitor n=1 Tax=Niallia taxi TaxID=2499688 RepID=UPI0015F6D65E|nr:BsuPI-related putative proteinase inhibitor [Niallia taxi]